MFKKLDRFPIVRALQVVAVIELVIGITHVVVNILPSFDQFWTIKTHFLGMIQMVLMTTGKALSTPVMLLALAEIIKLMRKKNDKN